jgi:hypothetical protein
MRLYLFHTWGLRREEADEVIADFVANRIVDRGLLEAADQTRGRFRTILTTSLQRYMIDRLRRQSRAPDGSPLPAANPAPAPSNSDPRSEFDRAWGRAVIAEAILRTRAHCERTGRMSYWELFEHRVVAPAADGVSPSSYSELVGRLSFSTPASAANALATAKRVFDRELRKVLAEQGGKGCDVEEELRELRKILTCSSARSLPAKRRVRVTEQGPQE